MIAMSQRDSSPLRFNTGEPGDFLRFGRSFSRASPPFRHLQAHLSAMTLSRALTCEARTKKPS
jgi:hypothetical protein